MVLNQEEGAGGGFGRTIANQSEASCLVNVLESQNFANLACLNEEYSRAVVGASNKKTTVMDSGNELVVSISHRLLKQ